MYLWVQISHFGLRTKLFVLMVLKVPLIYNDSDGGDKRDTHLLRLNYILDNPFPLSPCLEAFGNLTINMSFVSNRKDAKRKYW